MFARYRTRGLWWFRIFGYGLHWKDSRVHRLTFGERNGSDRRVAVGPWRAKVLRP